MRNKHLLYEFMKENRLQYNVPFWVENKMGKIQYVIKENKKEDIGFNIMAFLPETNEYIELDISRLTRIMFDNSYKIIRPTWKLEEGQRYYFVTSDGDIIKAKWEGCTSDISCFLLGNCFPCESEAEVNQEKILKLFLNVKPLVNLNEV